MAVFEGFEFGPESSPYLENRPSWLPAYERPPEDYWKGVTAQADPFWSTRVPMYDLGERLRGRYKLSAPEMGFGGAEPSFGQFFQDWRGETAPGYRSPDIAGLRARAQLAAEAGMTDRGQYLAGYDPQTDDFTRAAWLSSQFGPGAENAAANQRAVANLLAVQRPTGGTYGGQMAQAIRNAVYALQERRANLGDPSGTFLDWYLNQPQVT